MHSYPSGRYFIFPSTVPRIVHWQKKKRKGREKVEDREERRKEKVPHWAGPKVQLGLERLPGLQQEGQRSRGSTIHPWLWAGEQGRSPGAGIRG